MLSHPVILLLLLVLAALVVWLIRFTWTNREIDFIHRVATGGSSAEVADHVFDHIVPLLVRDGYKMVAQAGNTTVFERRFIYGWAFLVAIFLFPFGLVALLARGRETIVVISGPNAVEVNGSCSKPVADWIIAVLDEGAALAVELPEV